MTGEQITALAREYAESTGLFEEDKKNISAICECFLKHTLRRYSLVEKANIENIYKGILVQLDPKNFGYSPYNQGRMDVLKSLFPEIVKEVEE